MAAQPADLQLRYSTTAGYVPVPADFRFDGSAAVAVAIVNVPDNKIYLLAANLTTVVCIADAAKLAAAITSAQIGAANGVAGLDATGKIPAAQLPVIAATGLRFKGVWNAATNTPNLAASSPTEGDYYIVQTAGTTALGGEADWQGRDWAVFTNGAWTKLDNSPATAITGGAI